MLQWHRMIATSRLQRQTKSSSSLYPSLSKGHPFTCMYLKAPPLIPLLLFAFLLLIPSNSIADRTFYSVNILKTLFSSTPQPFNKFYDALNLITDTNLPVISPESVLPAFEPVSCACESNAPHDGSRTCSTPYPPPCVCNHAFFSCFQHIWPDTS